MPEKKETRRTQSEKDTADNTPSTTGEEKSAMMGDNNSNKAMEASLETDTTTTNNKRGMKARGKTKEEQKTEKDKVDNAEQGPTQQMPPKEHSSCTRQTTDTCTTQSSVHQRWTNLPKKRHTEKQR